MGVREFIAAVSRVANGKQSFLYPILMIINHMVQVPSGLVQYNMNVFHHLPSSPSHLEPPDWPMPIITFFQESCRCLVDSAPDPSNNSFELSEDPEHPNFKDSKFLFFFSGHF